MVSLCTKPMEFLRAPGAGLLESDSNLLLSPIPEVPSQSRESIHEDMAHVSLTVDLVSSVVRDL